MAAPAQSKLCHAVSSVSQRLNRCRAGQCSVCVVLSLLHICFTWPLARAYGLAMDFDDLLARYFGTASLGELPPAAREAGIERMLVDFGLSRDRGQRFALWSVLYLMGAGPDLEAAFPDPADRDAARTFMDMMAAANGEIGL